MDDQSIDTLLRETHRVAPPDTQTTDRARAALTATIADEAALAGRSASRLHRRRIGLAIAFVGAGTLGVVGAAAASGLFDSNTERMVNDADCDITSADARLVASETNPDGKVIEYWTINRSESFGDLLVEKLPDGTYNGSSLGCSAEPRDQIPFYADHAWASGALLYTPELSTELSIYGQIPPGSDTATVELSDGTKLTVTPDDEHGYFLHLVTLPPVANIDVLDLTPHMR